MDTPCTALSHFGELQRMGGAGRFASWLGLAARHGPWCVLAAKGGIRGLGACWHLGACFVGWVRAGTWFVPQVVQHAARVGGPGVERARRGQQLVAPGARLRDQLTAARGGGLQGGARGRGGRHGQLDGVLRAGQPLKPNQII